MTKPITLHLPNYYDSQAVDKTRLILTKTKALLKEDNNKAQCIASIEKVKNYQCKIPEIREEYQTRATRLFHRDREENWELQTRVSNCKVYTYNWDDKEFHFRIYWIVISEQYMLQFVGIFEPKFSAYYKQHFMLHGLDTEINTAFNFSSESNADRLFQINKVEISVEELQERIDTVKQEENKAKFLEENLRISSSNFYSALETELKEKQEVQVENFICSDWNMYYNLNNPENFSDPDSTIEWENNSSVYEYYEKPYTDNTKVYIACNEKEFNINALKNLITNYRTAEQKLLSFFEYYTFGNGGAYASAVHYQWAKIEIERLHKTTYTNQEFLKRNLCLNAITINKNAEELELYFKCSWDAEHGINVMLDKNYECKTVE